MVEHALAIYREVERFAPLNLRQADRLLLARLAPRRSERALALE